MGNIRQTRKNRSSTAKVRQKPKSKKKILHNPIVAANWNQKETFSQNYRRLGLAASLNDATGGQETSQALVSDDSTPAPNNSLGIRRSKLPTKINLASARVVRDENGAIISVVDEAPQRPNPLNDPLNELDDDDEEEWTGFNEHGAVRPVDHDVSGQTETVRSLVAEAAAPREKRVRKQSEREQDWIRALVDKHGDDYEAMRRDKLNIYQQSTGDIKRRVKKWRAVN